jgi:histidinol-phosphate aminotransferase
MEPYTAGKKLPGTLKLSSNENPLGASPKAVEAARGAVEDSYRYPDKSIGELRLALANHLGVEQDRIIVGNGSDELMVFAAGAFISPGSEAITAKHTFSQYAFATRLYDGTVIETEMPGLRFNPNGMLASLSERTRIIYVCNPNNPTGTYLSHEELERFLRAVPNEVLVFLDEAYADYADAPDFPRSLELVRRHRNLVVSRTFSKIYGIAGLRVGYAVGDPAVIASLEKVRQPFNVNLVGQVAARAALEDVEFLNASREMTRNGKGQLYRELGKRGVEVLESQANFLYIPTPEESERFVERIADGGVTVRPLASFGLPNAIRVTIGTEEQNRLFLQAFEAALAATGTASGVNTA